MLYQVDAFTTRPFHGNPAAVCLLEAPATEEWMQRVAAEMNLSETAFFHDGELRWFTPLCEVDLCGHATLATAHVLFTERDAAGPLRFRTKSGELLAERDGDAIRLDFPIHEPEPADLPDFGAAVLAGARAGQYALAELESEEAVRAFRPDFARIREAVGCVIVTAQGRGDYDFVSRFFGPAVGVDEDPVTGSAHCALAPYWAQKLGKTEMAGYQASARGGVVRVRLVGDRCHLIGHAVTVMRATLANGL